ITGTSSLIFPGSGATAAIILSKANNFTGQISFGNNSNNVLTLSDPNAIASASAIAGSSGTINLLSDTSGTFNTLSSMVFTTGNGSILNVDNNGSGTGNVIQFGSAGSSVALTNNRTLGITGGNGYSLYLPQVNLSVGTSGGTLNPTTANVTVGAVGNLN